MDEDEILTRLTVELQRSGKPETVADVEAQQALQAIKRTVPGWQVATWQTLSRNLTALLIEKTTGTAGGLASAVSIAEWEDKSNLAGGRELATALSVEKGQEVRNLYRQAARWAVRNDKKLLKHGQRTKLAEHLRNELQFWDDKAQKYDYLPIREVSTILNEYLSGFQSEDSEGEQPRFIVASRRLA